MNLIAVDNLRVLIQDGLAFRDQTEEESFYRQVDAIGSRQHSPTPETILPIVTVGRPEGWLVSELYQTQEMPALLRQKTDETDLYLVRFACSFRPRYEECEVISASLSIALEENKVGFPTVFDMHPLTVTQNVERSAKFTLNPLLKFSQVEASLGGAEFSIEYPELKPEVYGGGIGESRFFWEFRETKNNTISGSKVVHALIETTRSTSIVGRISLEAKVRFYKAVLNLNLPLRDEDSTARTWFSIFSSS